MLAQESRSAERLTALYESHATDVFRYALHLTGRREDAEDVIQFVFLQTFAALEAGTELVHPRAWLVKAAKRRSLNLIRDRREARMAGHDLPVAVHDQPDPEEAEALTAVRSTLWALPESQHQAFVLRHWSGLSQDEIADVLDTTPGAVESLLIRARRTLLEDQNQVRSECSRVRNRLVQAMAPTSGEQSHIASCRRCRTAQARLLRASEFASALALVPHPWVAHAIGNAVPGFGTGSAAAATTVTGAAGSGGAGAGLTAASAAAKVGLIAKVSLAAATAAVALGATNPVRNTVSSALFGHRPAHSEVARSRAAPPSDRSDAAFGQTPVATFGSGEGASAAGGGNGADHGKSATAGANGQGSGKANGKSATAGANGQGSGKANGKSATAGANGGKAATAGTNGQGSGKTNGKSATAGAGATGNGPANGKSATAGAGGTGNGPATGKSATSGTNGKSTGKPA